MSQEEAETEDEGVTCIYDKVKAKTAKATLYVMAGRQVWIPKSAILKDDGELVTMKAWIAKARGLEGI